MTTVPIVATVRPVTALPHAGERRCVGCGCVLRRHHDAERCECCERARLAYRPEHDPQFGARLLSVLVTNRGKPVNVYQALEITHCGRAGWICVWVHMRRLRQWHEIRGSHDGTYVYVRKRRSKKRRASGCASASR